MNELDGSYTHGFVDKCAELGVDPEALVKGGGSVPDAKTHPPTDSVARAKPMPRQPSNFREFVTGGFNGYLPRIGTGEISSGRALKKMPSGTALRSLREGYQKTSSDKGPNSETPISRLKDMVNSGDSSRNVKSTKAPKADTDTNETEQDIKSAARGDQLLKAIGKLLTNKGGDMTDALTNNHIATRLIRPDAYPHRTVHSAPWKPSGLMLSGGADDLLSTKGSPLAQELAGKLRFYKGLIGGQ